jgi:hypothetical protein
MPRTWWLKTPNQTTSISIVCITGCKVKPSITANSKFSWWGDFAHFSFEREYIHDHTHGISANVHSHEYEDCHRKEDDPVCNAWLAFALQTNPYQ